MSTHEELRRRLEGLNRQPLGAGAGEAAGEPLADLERLRRRLGKGRGAAGADGPVSPRPVRPLEPIVIRRDLPRQRAADPAPAPAGPVVALEAATDGAEVVAPDGSRVWLVERCLPEPEGRWQQLCEALPDALSSRGSGLWGQLRHVGLTDELQPEDLIFLDLETTGLTSSPLFLIGTMVWSGGGLLTRQYFARDYSEERAAVALFLRFAAGRKLLVSFNGKSFDLPYVRTRAVATGVPCTLEPDHLDLLHAARRVWKPGLPDCRLQTLERCICGRMRSDDIPGHLIPDAYHAYVRTGNARDMVKVLDHNFLDLVTLADIMTRLPLAPDPADDEPI